MKGIIYKDYLLALVPKNIFSILMDLIVFIPVVYFFRNIYGLALTCILLLPMTGTSLLQMTMEQDEICKFDKIQLTFPVPKKEIVLSKYLGALSFVSIFTVISLGVAFFYYGVYQVVDLATCLQIWAAGVIAGLIFISLSYVGFFLLGNKKGTIVYFILAAISVVVYLFGFFNFDVMSIFTINLNILLMIGAIIALVLLFISYTISLKIYTKRYS